MIVYKFNFLADLHSKIKVIHISFKSINLEEVMAKCDPDTCSLKSILLAYKAVGEKYLIDGGNTIATQINLGKLKTMIEDEAKSQLKTKRIKFFVRPLMGH